MGSRRRWGWFRVPGSEGRWVLWVGRVGLCSTVDETIDHAREWKEEWKIRRRKGKSEEGREIQKKEGKFRRRKGGQKEKGIHKDGLGFSARISIG